VTTSVERRWFCSCCLQSANILLLSSFYWY